MKALAFQPARGAVEIIRVPDPALSSADQVMVEMLRGGICATDRAVVAGRVGATPNEADFLVTGHESLGRVVETGGGVSTLRPGDLVSSSPRRPCAEGCEQCGRDRADLCETGGWLERGIHGMHGFFAELVVEHSPYLFRVSPELEPVAVLMEPVSVVEKALTRMADAEEALFGRRKRGKLLVLGAGPIGLLTTLIARMEGYSVTTVSIEETESRRAGIVKEAGADYVVSGQLAGGDFDALIDCTGHPTAAFDHLEHVTANSIVVLVGSSRAGHPREIDVGGLFTQAILKNQVWLATISSDPGSWRKAARDLGRIHGEQPGLLDQVITHRIHWEASGPAFLGRGAGEIKTVLEFGEGGGNA